MDRSKDNPDAYQIERDKREILSLIEIRADDSFGIQQAQEHGYTLKRSYLRDGAMVRTLVYELVR